MQGSHQQGRRRLQQCPAADSDCSSTEPECARGETHQDYIQTTTVLVLARKCRTTSCVARCTEDKRACVTTSNIEPLCARTQARKKCRGDALYSLPCANHQGVPSEGVLNASARSMRLRLPLDGGAASAQPIRTCSVSAPSFFDRNL